MAPSVVVLIVRLWNEFVPVISDCVVPVKVTVLVPEVKVPALDQLPPTLIEELFAVRVPAEIVTLPLKVVVLVMDKVPAPDFVRLPPVPVMLPVIVVLPAPPIVSVPLAIIPVVSRVNVRPVVTSNVPPLAPIVNPRLVDAEVPVNCNVPPLITILLAATAA